MKGTKLVRLASGLLCTLMLVGELAVLPASAATSSGTGSTSPSVSTSTSAGTDSGYQVYKQKYAGISNATESISLDMAAFTAEGEGYTMSEVEGKTGLYTPANGSVSWTVDIPSDRLYSIKLEYYASDTRPSSVERVLLLDGKVPFSEAASVTLVKNWQNTYQKAEVTPGKKQTAEKILQAALDAGFSDAVIEDGKVVFEAPAAMTKAMSDFCDDYLVRFFTLDKNDNELRPTSKVTPKWMTYTLRDSSGNYADDFAFYFSAGQHTITLQAKNEAMTIASITLCPVATVPSYEDYVKDLTDKGVDVTKPGEDEIKMEAEFFTAASNITLYPVEDRSNALTSPADVTRTMLNTVGGDKWQTAGQWIEMNFSVETSGMYDVSSRFKQDVLDGMSVCRAMYLYSDGIDEGKAGYYNGAPFSEARELMYRYNSSWQSGHMTKYEEDENGKRIDYYIYLEAGVTYTMRLEVTLGAMGDVVAQVNDILTRINNDYLEIIKLTGVSPDKYQDYGFTDTMPDVMVDMVKQSRNLTALSKELTAIAGEKSSNSATLDKIARLLKEMGTDDDNVAKNLSSLKDNIGTLGTFLSDAQTQPLQLDYVVVQPMGDKAPKANPNFFESFLHEMKGFFQSFVRDYDSMGAMDDTEGGSGENIEVWLASARDQSQVLRNLVTNQFTAGENGTGIAVDLKLVAGGTLLPSILAETGPDVYLGLGQGDVINYAIRSALLNIEGFEDFEETAANFNEAAMIVLGMTDADNKLHYYGLPENQAFEMMFVRTDILEELGLKVPETWDELMACIPTLQANNMQIGLTTDYKKFLYQKGGELFADDGMRINLDSQVALASFEKMCNLFTMYSFPYSYNASNRFRTGEMPIILGDYTGTYNQLKVFATEIEGKWSFMPLPGEIREDGSIDNVSISSVTACVMVKGCDEDDQGNAWKFMQWYTGEDCQSNFANEMVAILGPSAKQATANRDALLSLSWNTEELEQVMSQFDNLASVPNYPGSYIIDRYTNFAFLSAFNDKADPSEALLQYISTINKEILRKRKEFNLETLSDNRLREQYSENKSEFDSLLDKRTAQVNYLTGKIKGYDTLMSRVSDALDSEDTAQIMEVAAAVWAEYKALDADGSLYIADRNKTMGYDMDDTSLTKAEKKKLRNCFIYELYGETKEVYTQLRCCAEYLDDIVRLNDQKA